MRRSILPVPGDIAVVECFQLSAIPRAGCDVVGTATVPAMKASEFGILVVVRAIGSRREREARVCCPGCKLLPSFGAKPQSNGDQCGNNKESENRYPGQTNSFYKDDSFYCTWHCSGNSIESVAPFRYPHSSPCMCLFIETETGELFHGDIPTALLSGKALGYGKHPLGWRVL